MSHFKLKYARLALIFGACIMRCGDYQLVVAQSLPSPVQEFERISSLDRPAINDLDVIAVSRVFDAALRDAEHLGTPAIAAANRITQALPGSPQAAVADAYLAMARYRVQRRVDAELKRKLRHIAASYADLPVATAVYKSVCDDLVAQSMYLAALDLLRDAQRLSVDGPQKEWLAGYTDYVRKTMALRMTSRVHLTAADAKDDGSKSRSTTNDAPSTDPWLGKPMSITGPTADGRQRHASASRGKWTIVVFWATWCGPCRKELSELQPVYQQLRPHHVEFVGVALDSDKGQLKEYLSTQRIRWPQVMDKFQKAGKPHLADKYQIQAIPAVFLLNPTGDVEASGLRSAESIYRALDEVIH